MVRMTGITGQSRVRAVRQLSGLVRVAGIAIRRHEYLSEPERQQEQGAYQSTAHDLYRPLRATLVFK